MKEDGAGWGWAAGVQMLWSWARRAPETHSTFALILLSAQDVHPGPSSLRTEQPVLVAIREECVPKGGSDGSPQRHSHRSSGVKCLQAGL